MRVLRNPREPLAFAVLVLVGFVVARFLSVAVHEVLGHGLFALAFGGSFYGVYISPGSGFALVFLPVLTPAAAGALVALSGILIELVLGAGVYLAYPRVHTFLGRLFALLLLQVLLVYSFLYLALGALNTTGGDSAHAVAFLEAPHLTWAFVAAGLLWGSALAFVISREAVALVAPEAAVRRQVYYLILFWFTPLLVGVFPIVAILALLPLALLVYVAMFAIVGGAVFGGTLYLASKVRRPSRARAPGRPVGRLLPLALAFVLVFPAWFVPFGLTESTAHGHLLEEPPLEAERQWANPIAINVRADLSADGNVTLRIAMKGVASPPSPLEQRVLASYENRADFAYWREAARILARGATNATSWSPTDAFIGGGVLWSLDREVRNPRVVLLALMSPEEQSKLTSVTTNGTRTFLALTAFDPFRYRPLAGCPDCFLDEVNLTWPSGRMGPGSDPYRLESRGVDGGSPEAFVGYDSFTDLHFVRFRVRTAAEAATAYTVLLEVL